jgi:hypothetical protein
MKKVEWSKKIYIKHIVVYLRRKAISIVIITIAKVSSKKLSQRVLLLRYFYF